MDGQKWAVRHAYFRDSFPAVSMTISEFFWKSAELLRAVLHISGAISGFPITSEIAISCTVQKMASP